MVGILVTGANGQLGKEFRAIASDYPEINFYFHDIDTIDITDKAQINQFFSTNKTSYCINCAAYTDVDKAENEKKLAHEINVTGSRNIAEVCRRYNITLIHISTDFVFDGDNNHPYTEEDTVNPIGVYGQTKYEGEQQIKKYLDNHIIIRTSWLFSSYGNNFVKTMIKLGEMNDEISVVDDQIGTPTYARDLAKVIMKIIIKIDDGFKEFGIYNFSNEGEISWYDFAKAIMEIKQIPCDVIPIDTSKNPTLAKRPKYSVLDKAKIQKIFKIDLPFWKESLVKCLKVIN